MEAIYLLLLLWLMVATGLWLAKMPLFKRTWREPYMRELIVAIESDDWGPGADFHGLRLREIGEMLARHRDHTDRPAVMTADMVLAVPDNAAIRANGFQAYVRRTLHQDFTAVQSALRHTIAAGTVFPQIHGIEHLNGTALTRLGAAGDPRVADFFEAETGIEWESLDSPLQGHFVDGSELPTRSLPLEVQQAQVDAAVETFELIFGFASRSAVAPCYLWDDITEQCWTERGIRYIQTLGYRCPGRDAAGRYQQDPPLLRFGDRNTLGQYYLVRNAMYEPVDGRGVDGCLTGARQAYREALPVTISTHRYNYTRDEAAHRDAVAGLDHILSELHNYPTPLRYVTSPELGQHLEAPGAPLHDPAADCERPPLTPLTGLAKISPFLHRLWYRHAKLRLIASVTGLVLPLLLFSKLSQTARK